MTVGLRTPGYTRRVTVVSRDSTTINLHEQELTDDGIAGAVPNREVPNTRAAVERENLKLENLTGPFECAMNGETRRLIAGGNLPFTDDPIGTATDTPHFTYSARLTERSYVVSGRDAVRFNATRGATTAKTETQN